MKALDSVMTENATSIEDASTELVVVDTILRSLVLKKVVYLRTLPRLDPEYMSEKLGIKISEKCKRTLQHSITRVKEGGPLIARDSGRPRCLSDESIKSLKVQLSICNMHNKSYV